MPSRARYVLAPYVATPHDVVERMIRLSNVTAADRVYDLGCGDGRLAIAAAKRGARAFGIDCEEYWIEQARANALAAGVADRVEFKHGDATMADVSDATVVLLYLVEWSTSLIAARILEQAAMGARIVSYCYAIDDLTPYATESFVDEAGFHRTIYLWVTGAAASA